MPLGTLDRPAPQFFKQGTSALAKLLLFGALALFLMVADVRFRITQTVRVAVATLIYPLQWAVMRPVQWLQNGSHYFESLSAAQESAQDAQEKLRQIAQRANESEQFALENARLRKLLDLRERIGVPAQAAQVLYDAADPYSRKIIIDKGLLSGVAEGAPVIDESGVLGQVTRVYPSVSEVTLIVDSDQAIPVLNTRTGARAVAFGNSSTQIGTLELRFMATNSDVQSGDLLTTSGVDGVYPPGLPVAVVDKVERRLELSFAMIFLTPKALVDGAVHVMVLQPVGRRIAPRPPKDEPTTATKKARTK
jgi:rod shape-determining protein MreC